LQFTDEKFAAESLSLLKAKPSMRAAAVYNARGAIFAKYLPEGASDAMLPPLPGSEGVRFEGQTIRVFRRIVENGEILGTVYLESGYNLRGRILSYAAIVFAVTLASLLVSVLLSFWLQAGISRPIVEIAAVAREVVERKDYSIRARSTTHDEIGTLAMAFNDMLSEIERRTEELEKSTRQLDALNENLERRVRERTAQLEETNRQLEAFSYSVSHDLRAPLRAIDGFGQALIEDYGENVNDEMRRYLAKMRSATLRMAQLIEDLLKLARISRTTLAWQDVDLSALARQVLAELQQADPARDVHLQIWDGVHALADPRLIRIALENLLGNSWKFTSRTVSAQIEFGVLRDGEAATYFVRDNGAGFEMEHAEKLFDAFQRLHGVDEFPGTGVGLATVHRIVHRHGGRIWAHAEPGKGATFYFTLGGPW
jgi:signal transduction histidine kinase